MDFNYNKLKGRIKEMCGTQLGYAKALGISDAALSQRLNNKGVFTQTEIYESMAILKIEPVELSIYFFIAES